MFNIFAAILFSALFITSDASAETALKSEAEAGIVVTGGNSETTTVSMKDTTTYSFGENALTWNGRFLRASSQGIEEAYQWGTGLRYARGFTDSLSGFLGQALEANPYQGIEQRYSTDLGGKYHFEKSEGLKWFLEAGYRFNRENYPGTFRNFSFVRVFHEIERKFTPTFSIKWWLEFLPNLTDSKAYQANSEISGVATLNEVFSMKTGYTYRYNNAPPAGVSSKADTVFTTSLVAKF
jgi:putative salt-induced outer membrane protein